jgi:SAM-dependent methyltransferase
MDARRHLLFQRRGWDRASTYYAQYWQRQLLPAQRLLLATAELARGDRVLDVACGSGEMTIAVAAAVSPGGSVVATDLSPRMVSATEVRAITAGADNVEVACCNAQDLTVDGPFDVALCSLGLMYVPDPAVAVGELRRVVRPAGRVVLSVWGDRRRCGWASVFGIVDARVTSDVCPHFFALGAPGILTGVLRSAGFVDEREARLNVALDYRDGDEALGAAFLGGPVALAYGRFDTETRDQVADEYLASIEDFRTDDGGYAVPGEFVVASARRPD